MFKSHNIFLISIIILLVVAGALFLLLNSRNDTTEPTAQTKQIKSATSTPTTDRTINTTGGTTHSIPLDEILSGGPGKDGIPSIDNPVFISTDEADAFLDADSAGLGFEKDGVTRFYPYQILVWHEIVNDTIAGDPLLVTYCPLCATGVVFDRTVNGTEFEFGVSGKLWQSNLLMYNRTGDPETESYWSQILGEAVVGPMTGTELAVLPANTVQYGSWKENHPDTEVLSRETGARRPYGQDPYEGYYTSSRVSFGAEFSDDRLHPKEFILGIEIDGQYKAYQSSALPEGETTDTFADKTITIQKDDAGEVDMFIGADEEQLPFVGSFWFAWVAVHPDTALFK